VLSTGDDPSLLARRYRPHGHRDELSRWKPKAASRAASPPLDVLSCVFSELPDVVAAQRAICAMPQARLLTGMSCSAGAGTAESGHLVPNRSPTSSLVLLVGISHNRPAMFVQLP